VLKSVAAVDPDAKQVSVNGLPDSSYVVHCVGVEKEADLVPVFAVSLLSTITYSKC